MEKQKKHKDCFHCGEICPDNKISIEDKFFCCDGCKTVFEILDGNQLSNYYKIENSPGLSPNPFVTNKFDYLEDASVQEKLIQYKDESISVVTFFIPEIHCSSCIWLLENLYKLNDFVVSSRVNFLRKEVKLTFQHNELSLKSLVEILHSIGYTPQINMDQSKKGKVKKIDRKLIFKIGVAGFCFGNIMLLSLPEYFGLDDIKESDFASFFGYLNVILVLPVLLYSSQDYFKSAYQGLKRKTLNIDVPISIGIVALFLRSVFEILSESGAGYMDSLSGLVFFLLLGRIFQQKTYDTLSFERDYKSYFPIAVTKIFTDGEEKSVPVKDLVKGDRILVRNNEIIPVDALLLDDNAQIDSSFVTGESLVIKKNKGENIFAGCKQKGSSISLEVIKPLSQSYLTQLWNDDVFSHEKENQFDSLTNRISKYFTIVILLIAFSGLFYWMFYDVSIAFTSFTSVLIIACPCALALSAPFTFGNTLRIYGKNKFYLKNVSVIERMAKTKNIVFDKTGTLTKSLNHKVEYEGEELGHHQKQLVYSLLKESNHPLSKSVLASLGQQEKVEVSDYEDVLGKGLKGKYKTDQILIGSGSFVNAQENIDSFGASVVYVKVNEEILGNFKVKNVYRKSIKEIIDKLQSHFKLSILSGDNDSERETLKKIFKPETKMHFNQAPEDKLEVIKDVQQNEGEVIMIGDGLNDAGALQQANVGISISEDVNTFSPACDAILDANEFSKIPVFLEYSKISTRIIIMSFIISFLYNIVGMFFAIQGLLSPVIAAVLMPLSSITVVVFVTLATRLAARKLNL